MTDAALTPPLTERSRDLLGQACEDDHQYVSFRIENHWLGVPVSLVQEVLKPQRITPAPLARHEIAGLFNLRGQIVTAINLRRRLGLADRTDAPSSMQVVVRCSPESYGLLVDDVGDVIDVRHLPSAAWPAGLSQGQSFSRGVCLAEGRRFILLNVPALLAFE